MVVRGYDTGMAASADIIAAMALGAVRRSARTTRPGLAFPHRAAPSAVGITLGREDRALGRALYASLEEVVLAVAPPRSGKTAWLGNVVIDAPGACVATSTKADLYEHTHRLRARGRPVVVFNPEGLGDIPSTLRWSPLDGCTSPRVAMSRAAALLAGSVAGAGMQDRQFWEATSGKLLRCFLYAAAVAGRDMADVARWASSPRDRTALDILECHDATPAGWAADVRQLLDAAPDKTRDSVYLSLATTLQFMADPAISRAVLPARGEPILDVGAWIRGCGTLYLLATERPHGSLSPLFTALMGHLFDTASALASRCPGGRLDPPLLLALDEAALICPVPLERWTSDAGGRGISIVVTVQAPSQLRERWGRDAAQTIWSNAAVKLIFGGLTVAEHLNDISSLCGERDAPVRSHSDGGNGTRSRTIALRRVPVFSPDALRTLARLRTVILHRTTRPVLGRIDPVWERRDVHRATPVRRGARRKEARGERR